MQIKNDICNFYLNDVEEIKKTLRYSWMKKMIENFRNLIIIIKSKLIGKHIIIVFKF